MTEQNNSTPNTSQTTAAAPAKSSRRKWLIGGAAGLAAVFGLGAIQAYSQPGWGGPRHGGWHRMDPAAMGQRVDFGVDLILGRVQASAEQKTKIGNTIKAILKQAPDFRKGHEEARDAFIKALKSETVDKAELERLRADRIKAIDEASKKVVQAIGEVADTLTAKQRQELVEFAERSHGRFSRFRRWH